MKQQIGNVQLMQKMNRLKLLQYVRKNRDVTRQEIAEGTGLSPASITNICAYLLGAGLLCESGVAKEERVGRKSALLRFCAEAYGLVCAALYKNRMSVVYMDLEGNIAKRIACETQGLSLDEITALIRKSVKELIAENGQERTLAVCVTFSGMILDKNQFVFSSSMRWDVFDVKERLEAEIGLPVFVINNSFLRAVWCFCCAQTETAENMLFVDLDSGVGAVHYFRGEINRAVLGEIGHTTVEKDGEPCFCGNRGCLEVMCSAERVARLYEQYSGKSGASPDEVARLCERGDQAAERAVTECAKYLGIGLANLVNLFRPTVLLLGAGSFANCRVLLDKAESECRARAFSALTRSMSIRVLTVSEDEMLRGAAFEMCDRVFDLSFEGNPVR